MIKQISVHLQLPAIAYRLLCSWTQSLSFLANHIWRSSAIAMHSPFSVDMQFLQRNVPSHHVWPCTISAPAVFVCWRAMLAKEFSSPTMSDPAPCLLQMFPCVDVQCLQRNVPSHHVWPCTVSAPAVSVCWRAVLEHAQVCTGKCKHYSLVLLKVYASRRQSFLFCLPRRTQPSLH